MTATEDLLRYLQRSREAVLRGLDGISEYDARRPLVPSGTNVLGLIKHLATVEFDYFGECVGRPVEPPLPWVADGSVEHDADLWATPEQSREDIVTLYRRAWAHTDASIAALPSDAPATVPWWPPEHRDTTVGRLLVHLLAETAQHAGHVDILRETVHGYEDREPYARRVQEAADPFR